MLIGMSAFANRWDDAAHGFCSVVWFAIGLALSTLREMRLALNSLSALLLQHISWLLPLQSGAFAAFSQWFSFGNRQGGAPPWMLLNATGIGSVHRSKLSSLTVQVWLNKLGAIFILFVDAFIAFVYPFIATRQVHLSPVRIASLAFHKQTPKDRLGVMK